MIHRLLLSAKYGLRVSLLVFFAFLIGCASQHAKLEPKHSFVLTGGHFFGPGPIVPDTALPDGQLKGIKFDKKSFSGYATFYNDGKPESLLSDAKTKINQNIDAGLLDIGDGSNPLLLVAVRTGHNKGREYYSLDRDYRFVWQVDLALDPGFSEGIIQIDNFTLHTGLSKIAYSLQTQQGIPGGYDQAGSLTSGQYMAGRVGDFDYDGFMDGILVAAPNVPLQSTMLPGSPVGNQRGFVTDIEIEPHIACELAIRGIFHFQDPIKEVIENKNLAELATMLADIRGRLVAAEQNMEDALLRGAWRSAEFKSSSSELLGYLESARILSFMSHAFVSGYPNPTGQASGSTSDAIKNMYIKLDLLADGISKLNKKTGVYLPEKRKVVF